MLVLFFFHDTATTEIYTSCHPLSLHVALPLCSAACERAPGLPSFADDAVSAAKAAGASISAATTRKLAAWRIVLNLDLALHLDLRRIEIGLPAFGFDGAIRGVAANRLVGAEDRKGVGEGKSVSVDVNRGGG